MLNQKVYYRIIKNPTVNEPYYNNFTRYISALLTSIVYDLKFITPNIVTAIMLIFGLMACFFLFKNDPFTNIYAGIFFIAHNIFDTIDGDLARQRRVVTKKGQMLDKLSHNIINPLIFLSVSIAEYQKEFTFYSFGTLFLISSFIILLDQNLKLNFSILSGKINNFAIKKKSNANSTLLKNNFYLKVNNIFFSIIGLFHLVLFFSIIDFFNLLNIEFETLKFFLIIFSTILIIKYFLRISIILKKLN
jgi:phosphatidylglycerophosphate synthase